MKKWMETTIIKQDERGLLFHKGSYKNVLKPGTYRHTGWSGNEIIVLEVSKAFAVHGKELALFRQDAELAQELAFVDVQDNEYVLHYEDGRLVSVLGAGSYAYWNVLKEHRFTRVDIRQPELPSELAASMPMRLMSYCNVIEVASHERGMLHYNGVFQRELAPGKYYFWKNGPVGVQLKVVDLRQQQLDLTGQEMMTEDKITLRLNFVCQYQIVDPVRTLEIRGFEEQVYITLQLILREYVGTMKLDDLLRVKQEIGAYVLDRLNGHSSRFGVRFASAGVKDIILPGEVKDILNTVLLAEKRAQANLIMRREETASTRSLLNTAKLMEENGTLYRLKELEYLEKICDRVGSISLTGGGNLLEQLNALVGVKKARDHS